MSNHVLVMADDDNGGWFVVVPIPQFHRIGKATFDHSVHDLLPEYEILHDWSCRQLWIVGRSAWFSQLKAKIDRPTFPPTDSYLRRYGMVVTQVWCESQQYPCRLGSTMQFALLESPHHKDEYTPSSVHWYNMLYFIILYFLIYVTYHNKRQIMKSGPYSENVFGARNITKPNRITWPMTPRHYTDVFFVTNESSQNTSSGCLGSG